MLRKLGLASAAVGLAVSVGAHAADPLICDISECRSFSGAASFGAGPGVRAAQSWARNEIWGFTEDVLQAVGLQPNFELIETIEVPNAAAVIHKEQRILAYNPTWVKTIDRTAKWSMYGLLSHEIGHHLQGHTLLPGGSKPLIELEADKFAGFVLARLGASETEALSLWRTLTSTGSATHPGQTERLAAVRAGWANAAGAGGGGRRQTPPPSETAGGEYILSDSASRVLSARDIEGLSSAMLRVARNEIFARHGFTFESPDLRGYFAGRAWYRPRGKNVSLNAVEKANVDMIKAREASLGGEAVESGAIFVHSSAQRLTRDEVLRLSPGQRRLARNEIFARNGYIFNDPQLTAYFRNLPWYRPTRTSVELNAIEAQNVGLIRSME